MITTSQPYYLGWVCFECAQQRGAFIPEHHCCTVHDDLCGLCHRIVSVTEPRDFGNTRHYLYDVYPIIDGRYEYTVPQARSLPVKMVMYYPKRRMIKVRFKHMDHEIWIQKQTLKRYIQEEN